MSDVRVRRMHWLPTTYDLRIWCEHHPGAHRLVVEQPPTYQPGTECICGCARDCHRRGPTPDWLPCTCCSGCARYTPNQARILYKLVPLDAGEPKALVNAFDGAKLAAMWPATDAGVLYGRLTGGEIWRHFTRLTARGGQH